MEDSFTWLHNYCATEFANIEGRVKKGIRNAYYVDIIFERKNKSWICELSHRKHSLLPPIVQLFASLLWETESNDGNQYMKTVIPVSSQFDTMAAADEVKEWFDELWVEIESHPDLWL